MSNYDYEDDDDFDMDSSSNDLVKQLRKAAKQKDKELAELRSQFDGLNKAQRERSIKPNALAFCISSSALTVHPLPQM